MPRYIYEAFDRAGRGISGVEEAFSANDLVRRLSGAGLIVQGVREEVLGSSSVSRLAGSPPVVSHVGRQAHALGLEQSRGGVGGWVKPGARPTGFLKDYDLFLALSQMAAISRSGINAGEMMSALSQRESLKPKIRAAMGEVARMVSQGAALADAMEVYPEIFPPGVTGAVRAGEAGGYLPAALERASEQVKGSWGLRRLGSWLGVAVWTTLLQIPLFGALHLGLTRVLHTINDSRLNGVEEYLSGLRDGIVGWWGVLAVGMLVVWLLGPYVTGRGWFLGVRHRLGAWAPMLSIRSRRESLGEFSWHAGFLAQAGFSPAKAWSLAADAVPNRVWADRLKTAGAGMRETTSYSEALSRCGAIPREYADLVRTGEMTGTVPQAMGQVVQIVEGENRSLMGFMKASAYIWMVLIGFGVATVIFAVAYRAFYEEAFRVILE